LAGNLLSVRRDGPAEAVRGAVVFLALRGVGLMFVGANRRRAACGGDGAAEEGPGANGSARAAAVIALATEAAVATGPTGP
jgi:hypothetical protein